MDELEYLRKETAVLKAKLDALRQKPRGQMVADDFRRGQPDIISQLREVIGKAQTENANPWEALGIKHNWKPARSD